MGDSDLLKAANPYLREMRSGTLGGITASQLQLDPGMLRQAYCMNPPDDTCSFGYCAQPDIAGPLVRLSAYIVNLCLALLLWTSPHDAFRAFWPQLINISSVLAGCLITLVNHRLSRFHTMIAAMLIGSPATVNLWISSARTLWMVHPGAQTRTGKFVGWAGMMISMFAWYALVVSASSTGLRFSQDACDRLSSTMKYYPVAIVFPPTVLLLPTILVIVAARRARKQDEPIGFTAQCKSVWNSIDTDFPILYVTATIVAPFACWVAFIEVGVQLASPYDNRDWLSFGQIAAVFSALPPLFGVVPRVILYLRGFRPFAIHHRPPSPDLEGGVKSAAGREGHPNARRILHALVGPGTPVYVPKEKVLICGTRMRSRSF